MKKLFLLIVFFSLYIPFSISQEKEKKLVTKTFGGIQLINSPTTETAAKKSINLLIQHRFGQADLQNDFFKNLFGIDLVSNNRIGLYVPFGNSVMIGGGRTKYLKNYDLSVKYTFLKQRADKKNSFSSALNLGATIMSGKYPPILENYYYADGSPFKAYETVHRLTYTLQVILAKKFSRSISIQMAPAFIHRNLVSVEEENDIYVLPLGGRLKTGFFSSVIIEYAYVFNRSHDLINPFSIGWEKQTASHVFQVFISTSNKILSNTHYSNRSNSLIYDGKFYLGFNISKRLWLKD